MGRYYSKDLRARCVLAVEREGMSCRGAAARFGVAPSTVIGWVKAYRATGSFSPCAQGRPRGMKIAPFTDFIRAFMQDKDNTLTRLQAALLAEHGVYASRTLLHRFVRQEGLTYKKRRSTPESRPALMSP